jgi:hypothetical protein
MFTSTTKLIAILAVSAGLLATSSAFAKNGSGNSGSNHSQSQSQSQKNTGTFNTFKLNSSNSNSNNSSNSTSISKKPVTLSQNFSKNDSNKDHKNSTLNISLNSANSMKNDHKDSFCKKDKCWFDSCCSKCCYPYYFGCYYPIYDCYDYCTPTYTTCNYTVSVPLVQNVQPARTPVAVGSILMINGQTFGSQPGGARLRINGMAMPIEVLEWTPAGVKVRLPQIEIAGVTPADIEVIRVDGSVAAKSPIDLNGMPGQVAFNR